MERQAKTLALCVGSIIVSHLGNPLKNITENFKILTSARRHPFGIWAATQCYSKSRLYSLGITFLVFLRPCCLDGFLENSTR